MGYSTEFDGRFAVTPPLADRHRKYLVAFNRTRRMIRDTAKVAGRPDPIRERVGLPVGDDGAYFVGADGFMGQETEPADARFANESQPVGPDLIDGNNPPAGQPSLWCGWVPAEDGTGIEHDGGEKFHRYTEWLEYLVTHFLKPWGYTLNGRVRWQGDESDDRGTIHVRDNVVKAVKARVIEPEPDWSK